MVSTNQRDPKIIKVKAPSKQLNSHSLHKVIDSGVLPKRPQQSTSKTLAEIRRCYYSFLRDPQFAYEAKEICTIVANEEHAVKQGSRVIAMEENAVKQGNSHNIERYLFQLNINSWPSNSWMVWANKLDSLKGLCLAKSKRNICFYGNKRNHVEFGTLFCPSIYTFVTYFRASICDWVHDFNL